MVGGCLVHVYSAQIRPVALPLVSSASVLVWICHTPIACLGSRTRAKP